jgi:alpha-tubulin suppressor-like RCC1 family protein
MKYITKITVLAVSLLSIGALIYGAINYQVKADSSTAVSPSSGPATGGTDLVVASQGLTLATKTITQVSAGVDFTIALDSAGALYSWGANNYGQLGKGNNNDGPSYPENYVPTTIDIPTGSPLDGVTISSISAGREHVLVLGTNGHVYAWGSNGSGVLGKGDTTTDFSTIDVSAVPGSPLNGKTIVSVTAGASASFAIDSDGHLYVWGSNAYGQLGKGTATSTSADWLPVDISATSAALNGKVVTKVAAGIFHALALDTNGQVYSWGWNSFGELGKGNNTAEAYANYSPANISLLSNSINGKVVTDIATTAAAFSVALDSDGHVHTWGRNLGSGLLGKGNDLGTIPANCGLGNCRPVDISLLSNPLNGKVVTDIVVGCYSYYTLVVDADGKVYSWGQNTDGQLGKGNNVALSDNYAPVEISAVAGSALTGENIVAASTGRSFAMTLNDEGQIYAWGTNNYGQLGKGDNQVTDANYLPINIMSSGDFTTMVTPTVTLDVGGSPATCLVTSFDADYIYCTTSAHLAGWVGVTISSVSGTINLPQSFQYIGQLPSIPNTGA